MNNTCIAIVGVLFVVLSGISTAADKCPKMRFGKNCASTCNCLDDVKCDVKRGSCQNGCASGWGGATCQRENVALGRSTEQKDGKQSKNASFAVDESTNSCSETKPGVPGWWTVILDRPTRVETIKLVAGPSTNIKNWKIYVGMDESIFSMTLCTTIRIHGNGATLKCDVTILGQYVKVVNRVGPVDLCDLEIFVCSDYWYGSLCEHRCNCADMSESCDVETGACSSGCAAGWRGNGCQTECENEYGLDCKYSCGRCDDSSCDHMTGECQNGCQVGWTGVFCNQECGDRRFGKDCNNTCGNCYGDGACDVTSGKCIQGCQAGYKGDLCIQECNAGTYGDNCDFECGHCADDVPCDVYSGVCHTGCQEGWEGVFCTQGCLTGYYGVNCSSSCARCHNGSCDKQSGVCLNGCAPGYIGNDCDQVCQEGFYGLHCKEVCGNCREGDGRLCDVTSGACRYGCQPGYNETLCKEICPAGFYGDKCQKCGLCAAGSTCDFITGTCPEGCALNFYGDLCQQSDPFSDEGGPQLKIFLGATIGLVGGIMTLVIVCLVLMWQREHLPEVTKSKVTSSVHEICLNDQNGRVPVSEESEEMEYV